MGYWFKSFPQKSQVQYSISPFRAKLFDPIGYSIHKTFNRFASNVFYLGVPAFIGYSIYAWGVKTHNFLDTKAGAELKAQHQ